MAVNFSAKRLLRWTLLVLAGLLLLMVIATTWLGATQSGSQWLLQQVRQQQPGLSYKEVSGSLLRGLVLTGVKYQDDSLELTAAELKLDISARALFLPRLQIQTLSARQVSVTLAEQQPADNNDTAAPFTGTAEIILPDWLPPVRLARLKLDDISLQSADVTLKWQRLTASARLEEQLVTLSELRISQLHLILPAGTEQPATDDWPLASLPHLIAPVNTRIENLRLTDTRIEQGENRTDIAEFRLSLSWIDDKLRIKELFADAPEIASMALQANATLRHPYPLNLTASLTPAAVLLPESIGQGPWQLSATGDLSRLQASVQQDKLFSLTATANLTDQQLPFTADWTLQSQQLQHLISLPEQAKLQLAQAHGRIEGSLQQQNLSASLGFTGLGFGEVNSARLQLDAEHTQGQIHQLQIDFTDPDSGSALTLEGNLNYGTGLTAQLEGEISHLALNTPLLPYKGDIKGQLNLGAALQGERWQGEIQHLELSGTLDDTPLSIAAQGLFEQVSDMLKITDLQLRARALGAELEVAGQVDQQWALQGKLLSNDLSLLSKQLQGQTDSGFTVTGNLNTPRLGIRGGLKRLQYQQYQATDLSFSGDYQHGDNAQFNAQVLAPAINIDSEQLIQASLSLSGTEADHILEVTIDGDIQANATLTGQADLQQQQWQGQLSKFGLQMLNEDWQLEQETVLSFRQNALSIDAHCYLGKFSQLCLKDKLTLPGTDEISISAEVDYGQWANQTPGNQRLAGKASLAGTVSLPEQGLPLLDIRLKSTAGSLQYLTEQEQESEQEPEQITLLDWQQGSFTLQSEQQQITLEGALLKADSQPLLDISLLVSDSRQRTLSGNIQITPVPLQGFISLVPELSELTGILAADISLSGTVQKPKLDGRLNIDSANLRLGASQTEIRTLNMQTRFNGSALDFDGAFAMGDGSASFSGNSNWDNTKSDWQEALHLEASIKGDKLQVLAMPELRANISPDLQISFDNNLTLSGRVAIDSGSLTLTTLPASATAVSEDMQLTGVAETQKQAALCCNMDVDVEMLAPFVVSGFGFEGKIDGALQARQTVSEEIQLYGNLNVTQGTYKAYGQNLEVKSGRLQFVGPVDNPVVQLRAIRPLRGTNVEAGIQATGPANNIVVELFSNPAMEQSAILSYLLRGRPPGADSGDSRSMALVMAANQGIDLTGSSGLTEALNEIPLFSDVTLDTETDAVSGDSLATVSGYIGERIYLKYGVGIIEPVSQVTVRFYLLNQLWLEAVNSLERSMDLYYSFEVE
jgi:translocation and assembly module TamB